MDSNRLVFSAHHRTLNRKLIASTAMGNFSQVQELIHLGAFVNTVEGNGDTPLMLAAHYGHLPIVKYLLSCKVMLVNGKKTQGVLVNLTNKKGETALMLAAQSGNLAIVEALLSAGAKIECVDLDKKTALMHAVENRHAEVVWRFQRLCDDFSDPNLKLIREKEIESEPSSLSVEFYVPLVFSSLERLSSVSFMPHSSPTGRLTTRCR